MYMNFILVGKTGHGKSSTGNLLLGRKEFPVSASTSSKTKEVKVAWAEHGQYLIKVVDGPGLEDTDLSQTEDKQAACENMSKALLMCNGGVHAFILVIRFPMRFTGEERKAISDLKQIFGDNYLKEHGIIVVTGGDQFQREMEDDGTPNKSFRQWWREENVDVFKECSPRIVLVNNVTKNEEEQCNQRNEFFQHAEELSKEKGLYTNEHFKMYAEVRDKLIQRDNLSLLTETMQRHISLLTADVVLLSVNPSLKDVEHLERRIDDLHMETLHQDQEEQSLQSLIENLKTMKRSTQELGRAMKENNAINIKSRVGDLQRDGQVLETIKQSQWRKVACTIGKVAGGILLGGVAVAGAAVAGALTAVVFGAGGALLTLGIVVSKIAKFIRED